MSDAEAAAVDELLAQHPGKPASITRRDAHETGPLLVEVDGVVYELDDGSSGG